MRQKYDECEGCQFLNTSSICDFCVDAEYYEPDGGLEDLEIDTDLLDEFKEEDVEEE